MSERKKTPDLLGLVMFENNTQENKIIKQENHKNCEQESIKSLNIASNKNTEPESNKEIKHYEDEVKEKATFNLSKQILLELEDEWMNIRKAFGGNKRITKTLIVEVALEMALEEFKNREQNSRFYCKLADHKALKQ